jgi:uncharacterized Tic20 family protein
MTPHPPEPPSEWESSPQEMLAPDGRRPAGPAAGWPGPAQPPHALAGPPTAGYPGHGQAAGSYPVSGYDGGYPAGDCLPDYPSMPDYPAMSGYPPLSDYPSMPGYPPLSDHPSMPGYPPLSDHPSMPGYPPLSDYPSMPDYPPAPDYWPGPGRPAGSHVDHDEYIHPGDHVHPGDPAAPRAMAGPAVAQPVAGGAAIDELPVLTPSPPAPPMPEPVLMPPRQQPLVLEPGVREPLVREPLLREPGVREPAPGRAGAPGGAARPRVRPAGSEDASWAMLAYLTVPIFGCLVSLAIYLLSLRGSRWLRAHAAQALNAWLTWLLYNVSALIAGALLALDSPRVAVLVVLPVVATLWLVIMAYLIRAARLASRGREYTLPRWLCSPIIH